MKFQKFDTARLMVQKLHTAPLRVRQALHAPVFLFFSVECKHHSTASYLSVLNLVIPEWLNEMLCTSLEALLRGMGVPALWHLMHIFPLDNLHLSVVVS